MTRSFIDFSSISWWRLRTRRRGSAPSPRRDHTSRATLVFTESSASVSTVDTLAAATPQKRRDGTISPGGEKIFAFSEGISRALVIGCCWLGW